MFEDKEILNVCREWFQMFVECDLDVRREILSGLRIWGILNVQGYGGLFSGRSCRDMVVWMR